MLLERNFLWKQLNGPQAIALVKAVWSFFKESPWCRYKEQTWTLDKTLDYFNNINIDNCTDEHLLFIGTLMGIKRPVVTVPGIYDMLLKLQVLPQATGDYDGLSDEYNNVESQGGFLDELEGPHRPTTMEPIPFADYRKILKLVSQYQDNMKSLALVEDIVKYFVPSHLKYEFRSDVILGDINIYFNGQSDYQFYLMSSAFEMFFKAVPRIHIISSEPPGGWTI
jgi:hypothetical protein